MVNRALISALVLLLLLTGIQSFRVHNTQRVLKNTQTELSSTKQELTVLSEAFVWANESRKATESRLSQERRLQEKQKSAQQSLNTAVQSAPDWASQPVPAAVLDSLRQ